MKSELLTFAKMTEPERMLFIAQLHHLMWYDEAVFQKVNSIVNKSTSSKDAVFYPDDTDTKVVGL